MKKQAAVITCNSFGWFEYSGPKGKFGCHLKELAARVDLGNKDPIEFASYTLEGMSKRWSKDCGSYVDPAIIGKILDKNPEYTYAARREMSYFNRLWDEPKKTMAEIESMQMEYGIHPVQKLGSLVGVGAPGLIAKTYGCSDEVYCQELSGNDGLVGPMRKYSVERID